ncbi:MAG TPA: hypothetical protein VNG89_22125 [Vicinamibacterales bacterium]|nr:hypothetical protein [Vicinamibacterales bacterium]
MRLTDLQQITADRDLPGNASVERRVLRVRVGSGEGNSQLVIKPVVVRLDGHSRQY